MQLESLLMEVQEGYLTLSFTMQGSQEKIVSLLTVVDAALHKTELPQTVNLDIVKLGWWKKFHHSQTHQLSVLVKLPLRLSQDYIQILLEGIYVMAKKNSTTTNA